MKALGALTVPSGDGRLFAGRAVSLTWRTAGATTRFLPRRILSNPNSLALLSRVDAPKHRGRQYRCEQIKSTRQFCGDHLPICFNNGKAKFSHRDLPLPAFGQARRSHAFWRTTNLMRTHVRTDSKRLHVRRGGMRPHSQSTKPSPRMRSRLNWITDWEGLARQARYRVGRLARLVRVSTQQLAHYFRETFEVVPKEWLDELRCSDSLAFLQRGVKVKDAARRVGFRHGTHLTRMMRRVRGKTPGQLALEHARRAMKGRGRF